MTTDQPSAGWKPTGADPAAERTEFDPKPKPRYMGHPETDPPCTMRVRDWDRRFEPDVHRAIKTDDTDGIAWILITGDNHDWWCTDNEVRSWPVVHHLTASTAFGHAEHQRATEQAAQKLSEPESDMGVEAFRG